MTNASSAPTVAFSHAVFRNLQPVLFRRTEDGHPVMMVSLGATEAMLPLGPLRREFAIADGSDDGRMLSLIEQALDYVAGIKPGDRLPPEVLDDGGASFEPTREHQRRAALRVQAALGADPSISGTVSPHAVAMTIEEFAWVESLRSTLIERVGGFRHRTESLARAHRGESQRALAASQVARLARVADARLGDRFQALDQVDTASLLRAPAAVLPGMQTGRDVLHRNRLAWTPTLDAWDQLPGGGAVADWNLVDRTYRFLAPRYMTTTEWHARFIETLTHERAPAQMIW